MDGTQQQVSSKEMDAIAPVIETNFTPFSIADQSFREGKYEHSWEPIFQTIEIPLERSEEHTSELQSRFDLVCRLLLEKKKTLTFMVGMMQLLLGLLRMGTLVNSISHTVIVGSTAGAAALIAVSPPRHSLGLPIPTGRT